MSKMLPYRFGDIKQMQKKTLSKHWSLGSLQKLRSPLYPLHLSVINAKHELSRNGQGDPAIPHMKRDRKRMFRLAATFLRRGSDVLGLFADPWTFFFSEGSKNIMLWRYRSGWGLIMLCWCQLLWRLISLSLSVGLGSLPSHRDAL